MRRRRPAGRKIYTVKYLLDKQPKTLSRDDNYSVMINYLRSSPNLRRIKFNRRCYSLLNNAIIKPENLVHFYKTYRLPRHPFFPIFFMIKRNYLKERENKKKDKEIYIQKGMKSLEDDVLRFLWLVLTMEKDLNRAGLTPLYTNLIKVKTKKQINIFLKFKHSDWLRFFRNYLEILLDHYDKQSSLKIDQLSACFILKCLPMDFSILPEKSVIKNRYRSFCKEYHPDRGGDPELFMEIKWAYDLLLN